VDRIARCQNFSAGGQPACSQHRAHGVKLADRQLRWSVVALPLAVQACVNDMIDAVAEQASDAQSWPAQWSPGALAAAIARASAVTGERGPHQPGRPRRRALRSDGRGRPIPSTHAGRHLGGWGGSGGGHHLVVLSVISPPSLLDQLACLCVPAVPRWALSGMHLLFSCSKHVAPISDGCSLHRRGVEPDIIEAGSEVVPTIVDSLCWLAPCRDRQGPWRRWLWPGGWRRSSAARAARRRPQGGCRTARQAPASGSDVEAVASWQPRGRPAAASGCPLWLLLQWCGEACCSMSSMWHTQH